MARNSEKAQSMLARFLRRGEAAPERRPRATQSVTSLGEAERWRGAAAREVEGLVASIQDGSLEEGAVRDMNDRINRVMREVRHWDRRVRELGGPDRRGARPSAGAAAFEADGYYYWGAARELPGVRELFEKKRKRAAEAGGGNKRKMPPRAANAAYFGYYDDDDGTLARDEAAREAELATELAERWARQGGTEEEEEEERHRPAPVPSQEEIERRVLEARKKRLLEQVGGD